MQKVNIDFIYEDNTVFNNANTKIDDFYIAMASSCNSIYIGNGNTDSYIRVGAGTIDFSATPFFKNGITYGNDSLNIVEYNNQYINFDGRIKDLLFTSANNTIIKPRLEVNFEENKSLMIYQGDVLNTCCYIGTLTSNDHMILQGNSGNIAIGIEKVPEAKVEVGENLRVISQSNISSYLDLSASSIDSSSNQHLFIQSHHSNNNIGIGFNDRAPQAKLEIIGTMYISDIVNSSDDRIKTEEKLITNATETLSKLKPQVYLKDRSRVEAGLIAQEVYYGAPELRHLIFLPSDANKEVIDSYDIPVVGGADLTVDPEYKGWGEHMAGVNYIELIPYLITALQETTSTIRELQNRIYNLESN